MAHVLADRVYETTTTTGVGPVNLDGAITGFQSFVTGIGSGNTTCYTIENGIDWEVGLGTVTAGSPNTLSRTTILASSNGGAAVNFVAGVKNVFVTYAAGRSVFIDNAGAVTLPASTTIGATTGYAKLTSGAVGTVSAATVRTELQGDGSVSDAVGFRTLPQNSQSAAYTLVLGDSGKHLLHPSADTTARTFTIPANATVAFPVGTAITFVNQNGAGAITIAITTDTMRLAGAGTTGSRTLAANGVATALKITATEWIISGTGLT